jgi:hypothetical protein
MGPNHDHNVKVEQIANVGAGGSDAGHGLMASVGGDGKFTIINDRTGLSKMYAAR